MNDLARPLGTKAYGSIGHLPNSRMGPADRHVAPGQAAICTEKPRDRHDVIVVQEKVDGSCVAVACLGDGIVALTRGGYPAEQSNYEQHRLFAQWVGQHAPRFMEILKPGERLVGEWLALAHGTRYALPHEPLVAFDLIAEGKRLPYEAFWARVASVFVVPRLLSMGPPVSVERAVDMIVTSGHGAVDPVEGAVWRVERRGVVDFLAKYVRPDKVDGCYLETEVWNWHPSKPTHCGR